LFSVLAQFFGADAINDRLLLSETISFTTPADMLECLTRIIAHRSVGAIFFGNYKLMDFELMGGDARVAIIAQDRKRGIASLLPPLTQLSCSFSAPSGAPRGERRADRRSYAA
jgi:hypothetical protein